MSLKGEEFQSTRGSIDSGIHTRHGPCQSHRPVAVVPLNGSTKLLALSRVSRICPFTGDKTRIIATQTELRLFILGERCWVWAGVRFSLGRRNRRPRYPMICGLERAAGSPPASMAEVRSSRAALPSRHKEAGKIRSRGMMRGLNPYLRREAASWTGPSRMKRVRLRVLHGFSASEAGVLDRRCWRTPSSAPGAPPEAVGTPVACGRWTRVGTFVVSPNERSPDLWIVAKLPIETGDDPITVRARERPGYPGLGRRTVSADTLDHGVASTGRLR